MPGAIAKAKEIAESNPSQYFMPGQFDNPANPEIHFKTTGPEIWDDCDGEIDVLVAGLELAAQLQEFQDTLSKRRVRILLL